MNETLPTEREHCFAELLDRNLPMLRSAAFRVVGNRADADEAVQQACLAAWRQYHSFRGEAKLSSWLYRITINESYNLLRLRKREAEKARRFAANPVEPARKNEAALLRLEDEIGKLPVPYREAIHYGVLSGMSGVEAAERLNCTPNTLYQRIFKAKTLLRKAMGEGEYE